MEYEKPTILDAKLQEKDPEISPMGFIVLVFVLVAGVVAALGAAVGGVIAAGGAAFHVAAGVNTQVGANVRPA